MNTRSGRFPLVDALRAVAALSILFYHLAGYAGAYPEATLVDLALALQVGVTLFFVISGFLLYRPFVAARIDGEPMPAVGVYAWRRFLRIVPAYWVVLTCIGLSIKPEVFEGHNFLLFYGFAQVYDANLALSGLSVAWSLCIEVSFYAMLPIYALAMRGLPRGPRRTLFRWELAGLVALAVGGLAFRAWAVGGGATALGSPINTLPAHLYWFALGMGLAVVSVWLRSHASLPRPLAWLDRMPGLSWIAGALAFAASAAAIAHLTRGTRSADLSVHVLFGLTALAMALPAVIGDPARGAVRRVMAWPVLAWLGLVSYGIFLWQIPVIHFLGEHTFLSPRSFYTPNVWWLVVAPPFVVAAAAVSYYVVERPALKLKPLVKARGATADQPGAVSVPSLPEPR